MSERISPAEFHAADGVDDWRVVAEGACAVFHADSFAGAGRFVEAIAALPGVEAHAPDLDVRGGNVTVRLVTISAASFGLTSADLELARRVSDLAATQGLRAEPSEVQTTLVAIDALVTEAVLPFWRALLGYVDRGDSGEDLIDPRRRGPAVWFQPMDAPRPQRNRIHLDVWVPHDCAEERVQAALAAGGRLVTDAFAPSWWVLADAEGNEACVGTWQSSASPAG